MVDVITRNMMAEYLASLDPQDIEGRRTIGLLEKYGVVDAKGFITQDFYNFAGATAVDINASILAYAQNVKHAPPEILSFLQKPKAEHVAKAAIAIAIAGEALEIGTAIANGNKQGIVIETAGGIASITGAAIGSRILGVSLSALFSVISFFGASAASVGVARVAGQFIGQALGAALGGFGSEFYTERQIRGLLEDSGYGFDKDLAQEVYGKIIVNGWREYGKQLNAEIERLEDLTPDNDGQAFVLKNKVKLLKDMHGVIEDIQEKFENTPNVEVAISNGTFQLKDLKIEDEFGRTEFAGSIHGLDVIVETDFSTGHKIIVDRHNNRSIRLDRILGTYQPISDFVRLDPITGETYLAGNFYLSTYVTGKQVEKYQIRNNGDMIFDVVSSVPNQTETLIVKSGLMPEVKLVNGETIYAPVLDIVAEPSGPAYAISKIEKRIPRSNNTLVSYHMIDQDGNNLGTFPSDITVRPDARMQIKGMIHDFKTGDQQQGQVNVKDIRILPDNGEGGTYLLTFETSNQSGQGGVIDVRKMDIFEPEIDHNQYSYNIGERFGDVINNAEIWPDGRSVQRIGVEDTVSILTLPGNMDAGFRITAAGIELVDFQNTTFATFPEAQLSTDFEKARAFAHIPGLGDNLEIATIEGLSHGAGDPVSQAAITLVTDKSGPETIIITSGGEYSSNYSGFENALVNIGGNIFVLDDQGQMDIQPDADGNLVNKSFVGKLGSSSALLTQIQEAGYKGDLAIAARHLVTYRDNHPDSLEQGIPYHGNFLHFDEDGSLVLEDGVTGLKEDLPPSFILGADQEIYYAPNGIAGDMIRASSPRLVDAATGTNVIFNLVDGSTFVTGTGDNVNLINRGDKVQIVNDHGALNDQDIQNYIDAFNLGFRGNTDAFAAGAFQVSAADIEARRLFAEQNGIEPFARGGQNLESAYQKALQQGFYGTMDDFASEQIVGVSDGDATVSASVLSGLQFPQDVPITSPADLIDYSFDLPDLGPDITFSDNFASDFVEIAINNFPLAGVSADPAANNLGIGAAAGGAMCLMPELDLNFSPINSGQSFGRAASLSLGLGGIQPGAMIPTASTLINDVYDLSQFMPTNTSSWLNMLGASASTLTIMNAAQSVRPVDPLVIDLDGDGIELTPLSINGTRFDVDADGAQEQTGWVGADDGLLVVDRNGDGQITDITEIVSEEMIEGTTGSLQALAHFDQNDDGAIDIAEATAAGLQIWQDHNQDGITDIGELHDLSELSITRFNLDAIPPQSATLAGNSVNAMISVETETGQVLEAAEILFNAESDGTVSEQIGDLLRTESEAGLVSIATINPDGASLDMASEGAVVAHGGMGDDVITGGDGHDLIFGHGGNDTLIGGAGDDWIVIDGEDSANTLDGGEGRDVVQIISDQGVKLSLAENDLEGAVGGKGGDVIFGGGTESLIVSGKEGDDVLVGSGTDDILVGDDGNDYLNGAGGNDYLRGGRGNDGLIGGVGTDWLRGGAGNDRLYGGADNDQLHGDGGDDYLDGGDGYDIAQLSGSFNDYKIEVEDEKVIVTDLREEGDGRDILVNIEA